MVSHTSSHTADTLRQELKRVDWSRVETAYGVATSVPSQLERLYSHDHADAMLASHELWCGLCHQHAFVSTAALPALPFLLRALEDLDDKLKTEILDILYGFVVCTGGAALETLPEWEQQLRRLLVAESPRFTVLQQHPDPDVSSFATMICEELDTPFWKRRVET